MSARRLRAALAAVVAAAVLASGAALPATADDLDDDRRRTESERDRNAEALEDLHDHLEDTDAALLETQRELEQVQAKIPGAEAALQEAEDELVRLQREAEILAERLAAAKAEEASIGDQMATDDERAHELRAGIGRLAREAYKGDIMASSLSAVLDATSTEDFVDQSALTQTALRTQTQSLRELEQLTGANRNRQVRLEAVREQVSDLKDEADANVVAGEKARQAAEDRRDELEALQAQQQDKLAEIERKKEAQLAKQAKIEREQDALEKELRDIIRKQKKRDEERRKAEERRRAEEAKKNDGKGSGGGSSSGGGSGGGGGGGSSTGLSWPTPAPVHITSSYGWRIHPVYGYRKLHAGTDFRAYCGNPIIAAAPGTVLWAYMRGGYGNQVMLDHGSSGGASLMTSYNHLSRFAVRSGQKVERGQVVGYSGTTGTSTACHLHFEVYRNGATVNPMNYL